MAAAGQVVGLRTLMQQPAPELQKVRAQLLAGKPGQLVQVTLAELLELARQPQPVQVDPPSKPAQVLRRSPKNSRSKRKTARLTSKPAR
jgi:hypothetical protein